MLRFPARYRECHSMKVTAASIGLSATLLFLFHHSALPSLSHIWDLSSVQRKNYRRPPNSELSDNRDLSCFLGFSNQLNKDRALLRNWYRVCSSI